MREFHCSIVSVDGREQPLTFSVDCSERGATMILDVILDIVVYLGGEFIGGSIEVHNEPQSCA